MAPRARASRRPSLPHATVAIDPGGAVRASIGDPDLVVYPRSCLKPMQAHAMVAAGLELDDRQLAVACASHDGSPAHLDVVRSILERYDLAESDLRNTPARPYGAAARTAARNAGIEPSALQQNCSGKHAAMLATCRVNGWSIDDYLDQHHPVQTAITNGVEGLDIVGAAGIRRLFIGGLTTDYCILNSVKDARGLGFEVFVLADAIRAVDVQPGDGQRAEAEMARLGAWRITLDGLVA